MPMLTNHPHRFLPEAWPFAVPDNSASFTTVRLWSQQLPILQVFHCQDGDWQFLGDEENLTEDDAVVISIEELLSIDKSVKEVLNMPIEKQAMRINKESSWYYFEL